MDFGFVCGLEATKTLPSKTNIKAPSNSKPKCKEKGLCRAPATTTYLSHNLVASATSTLETSDGANHAQKPKKFLRLEI